MAGVIEQVVRLRDEASAALRGIGTAADAAGAKVDGVGESAQDAEGKVQAEAEAASRSSEAHARMAAGAAAAAVALFGMAQQLADSTNELTNWSTRTGVAADTLGGLRLAAQGAGLDFQSVAEPLLALARNTAQAAAGNAELERKFAALGVATTDADGSLRSTDAVLRDVLERLSGMSDPAERAAAATAVLGEQGTRLLQALGNAGALDHFIAQAASFGVDVGPRAAASAAQWERTLATLRTVVEGLGQDMLRAFGGGAAGGVIEDFTLGLVYLGTVAETVVTEVVGSFRRLFEGVAKLGEGDFRGAFGDITDSAVLNVLGALPGALDKAQARMEALRASMRGIAEATGTGAGGGEGGSGFVGAMGAATAAVQRQDDALKRLLATHAEVMRTLGGGAGLPSASGFTLESAVMTPFERALRAGLSGPQSMAGTPPGWSTGASAWMAQLGQIGGALGGLQNPLGMLSGLGPEGAAIAQALSALEAIGREGVDKIVMRLENMATNIVQGAAMLPELVTRIIDELPRAIGLAIAEALRDLLSTRNLTDRLTPGRLLNSLTMGGWGLGTGLAEGLGINMPGWLDTGRDAGWSSRTATAMLRRPSGRALGLGGGGGNITINGFVSAEVMDSMARASEADFSPWGVGRGRRSVFGG